MPEEIKKEAAPTAAAAEPIKVVIVPPPAPTKEEIEAEAAEFIQSQFGNTMPKKEKAPEPKPEPEAEVADEPEKEPETEKEPEPEKAPKKAYNPGKKADVSAEEIETIARRVAAEEREAAAPPAAKQNEPAPEDTSDLSYDNRNTLEVVREMELANPARYKGLGNTVRKFWKAELDYRDKWQAQNPEETFQKDDPDHREFYRRHEPNFEPEDYQTASREIVVKAATERALEKMRMERAPQDRKIKAEEAKREAQPEIEKAVEAAVKEVFKAAPEFEKLVPDGTLTQQAVDAMAEINPVVHHHVVEESEFVWGVINELEKLTRLRDHYEFNAVQPTRLASGRVIYPHALINETYHELEAKLSAAPKADRLDEGREFMTNAERMQRAESIRTSTDSPEAKQRQLENLKKNYWSIAPEHIRNRIIGASKTRIEAITKKFGHFTKAGANGASGKNSEVPAQENTQRSPAKALLAKGSGTSASSDTADNAKRLSAVAIKEEEEFARHAFP